MIGLEELIHQAYCVIGRGEKLRPEQVNQAITALDIMFKSWSNKGHDLWKVSTQLLELSLPQVVEHNGKKYVCCSQHTSSEFSEPGAGVNSNLYWIEISDSELTEDWDAGVLYGDSANVSLTDEPFAIGNLTYIVGGRRHRVKLVSQRKFSNIEEKEIGTPKHAVFSGLKAGISSSVSLHPIPFESGAALEYSAVKMAGAYDATTAPENWISAIKYGLAVELGYLNGIPHDTHTSIVNKFQYEFRRARGSEQEVTDSCFVEPLF